MLDEATAAAEAMTFCKRLSKNRTSQAFFASRHCHPQTLDVLRTRAEPLGIEVVVGDESAIEDFSAYFGALLQYPTCDGEIVDYMVARYGDFVRYKPPVNERTWLLWFGPGALLLFGVLVIGVIVLRRRRTAAKVQTTLSAEEQARLANLLKNDK